MPWTRVRHLQNRIASKILATEKIRNMPVFTAISLWPMGSGREGGQANMETMPAKVKTRTRDHCTSTGMLSECAENSGA